MKIYVLRHPVVTALLSRTTNPAEKLLFYFALIVFCCWSISAQAQPLTFKWTSSDTSIANVMLGPEAIFKWKNADGSEIELTGGTVGSSFSFTDTKTKGGNIAIDPVSIRSLTNPNYGTNGEPQLPATGQITEGAGSFQLSLKGFKEIADVDANFTASLVSDGTDNPINLSLFGQGDQLAFNPPGSVDYISKWTSSDVINLSNGQQLQIGNFFLLGGASFLPDSSQAAFSYSLGSPGSGINFASSFTTGEKYIFTDESFAVSRLEVVGKVSKDIVSLPEPATPSLLLLGIIALCLAQRRWQPSR